MPVKNTKDINAKTMAVTVVYIVPSAINIEKVRLYMGETVKDAVDKSGLLARYPDIDLDRNRVGIFGRLSKLDAIPVAGDRIEIYRALKADPKESRRRRARKSKQRNPVF